MRTDIDAANIALAPELYEADMVRAALDVIQYDKSLVRRMAGGRHNAWARENMKRLCAMEAKCMRALRNAK